MKLSEVCNDPPGVPWVFIPLSSFLQLLALAPASNRGLVKSFLCDHLFHLYPKISSVYLLSDNRLSVSTFLLWVPTLFPKAWLMVLFNKAGAWSPRCFFTGLAWVLDYCGIGPNTSLGLLLGIPMAVGHSFNGCWCPSHLNPSRMIAISQLLFFCPLPEIVTSLQKSLS